MISNSRCDGKLAEIFLKLRSRFLTLTAAKCIYVLTANYVGGSVATWINGRAPQFYIDILHNIPKDLHWQICLMKDLWLPVSVGFVDELGRLNGRNSLIIFKAIRPSHKTENASKPVFCSWSAAGHSSQPIRTLSHNNKHPNCCLKCGSALNQESGAPFNHIMYFVVCVESIDVNSNSNEWVSQAMTIDHTNDQWG